jgi:uncharacterized protein (TIGR01777 family)
MVKHILITGASGLIGSRLTTLLLEKGYSVAHLGRAKKEGKIKSFVWNVDKFAMEPGTLHGITTIIHLAGAGVADKRWSEKRKEEILNSRIQSTSLLYEELKKGHHTVTNFISASAIGYYGFENTETVFTEESPPGNDFLAQVTRKWEDAVEKIRSLDVRVVKLRFGVVLSDQGGALKEIAKPIKLFAGAPLGSGYQQVSWIHIDDLCNMIIKTVEEEQYNGVYNAVGPYPVTNRELTLTIAKGLNKPLFLPSIPPFVLKLMLGEIAELVLNGSKVSSEKIQKEGYVFEFDDLEEAIRNLLTKKSD